MIYSDKSFYALIYVEDSHCLDSAIESNMYVNLCMSNNQNLANNIKKLREAKGLSQEKLARLGDVANNTLIKMESGENKNPTLDTLKKVAKALVVSIDDLIG